MKLKKIIKELKKHRDKILKIQNGLIVLDGSWDSYRGSYEYLSLGYEAGICFCNDSSILTVNELINLLEGCVGEELQWYKGGVYLVDKNLAVYVSNFGCASGYYIDRIKVNNNCVNIELRSDSDDIY